MNDNDVELKENCPIQLRQQFRPGFIDENEKTSKMATWLINHSGGIIKNEKQANYILIGITVISFSTAIWMFIKALL